MELKGQIEVIYTPEPGQITHARYEGSVFLMHRWVVMRPSSTGTSIALPSSMVVTVVAEEPKRNPRDTH